MRNFPIKLKILQLSIKLSFVIIRSLLKSLSKGNISADGSEQRRDALFWIYLRQTWLNLFGLILAALSSSSSIISIAITLFIYHLLVLFSILILLEQTDDFVSFPPWCILKDRQLCVNKYLKYWVLNSIIA